MGAWCRSNARAAYAVVTQVDDHGIVSVFDAATDQLLRRRIWARRVGAARQQTAELLDVAGVAECVGPVVGVTCGDALLGVLAAVVVVGGGSPFDRHDLQRGEQQRGVQAVLVGETGDVTGDLDGDCLGGDAARRVRGGDDEPCAAADQC
jgi:hypothetical protein